MSVDYVFIPWCFSYISGCADLFPKSLCYNLGFLVAPKGEWNFFLDADIIVPENFFVRTTEFINKNPKMKWFIPYSDLYRITEDMDFSSVLTRISLFNQVRNERIAAPWLGGCIAVLHDAFREIGGYDPEFFCGWAPEDIWLVEKLHLLSPTHRLENSVVFHMEHERQKHMGNYTKISHLIVKLFKQGTLAEKTEFINFKSELLSLNGTAYDMWVKKLVVRGDLYNISQN